MRLLQRQVDTLANCERAAVLDRGRLGQVLRASAADVKAVLSRHSQEARKALQLFLRDRLCFTPMERDGRRGYRFQGEGTYNGLLSGEAFPPTMVAPTGFEPVFSVRHARPDPDQHARVPDRREHHPIDRELLDAME